MIRPIRRLLLTIAFLAGAVPLFAQEVLNELQFNPVVMEKAHQPALFKAAGLDTIPVGLPFFDDFSSNSTFPSYDRWIDRTTFVNNDLAVFPVNIGAVTFDAISDSGTMYPWAVPGPATFIADHLTSRYIRLDSVFQPVPRKLVPADSVYLSFFYQPQGRAKAPQEADSLVLEFLEIPAHDTIILEDTIHLPDRWRQMWQSEGMPLDTFYRYNEQWFVQVMVPVTDTLFLKKNFRFRFYNYVSLASSSQPDWQSNASQWNIDMVYLNLGRNMYDTVYPEMRFVYPPPSLLNKYESMPYKQYCNDPSGLIKDTLDMLMTNRDIIPHMSSYGYNVSNPSTGFSKSYSGGSYNVQPYMVSPYVTFQKFAHPEVPFVIPIGTGDSAVFTMKHTFGAPGSGLGDTITGYQRFYNYFAYDNGTPEASYGLQRKGMELAVRFRMNLSPDTLRAVRMYFNRTLSNASMQFFELTVWNDNDNKPGNILYSAMAYPKYADSINKFVTYHLDPPLVVTGTFYIGWIQTTDDNLSVGFDRYNNSQSEILYKLGATWTPTAYSGSVMIRPVVGKPIPLSTDEPKPVETSLTVYPNPCNNGLLCLRGTDNLRAGATVRIFDITGALRLESPLTGTVDVRTMAPGLYILEVRSAGGPPAVTRFVVGRP